ncbi:DUF1206 domain-containing protein [Ilumatobacter coccineus]|uniref:DUF1206 domain-containing protein n=1 Tax=Ilumatobacter coccineus (strain NBRC 103263 / KCTC 29153 / YM16-304) TaxID=1313172 RepID=A0A6C7E5Q7_ILUCY|nr:DUF1206 domain-containing protein [Ilumatobacter coccineus]BAN00565.1 hypothetical protein YM304_02510 [Ilumatobacter coccineus YM16-304]
MGDTEQQASNEPDRLTQRIDELVDANPVVHRIARLGWIAKAVVYGLMGFTAMGIAFQRPPSGDASPQGSLRRIAEAPLGRIVLVVMAVGLACYIVWRVLSVSLIRGNKLSDWGDRIGYSFSAIFYVVLAWSAASAAYTGDDPGGTNSVEELSRSVLEAPLGRVLLGVGGVVTIAIGLYFSIEKGLRRSFADELQGVDPTVRGTNGRKRLTVLAGLVGWVGRGIVLVLVGYFVARSAIRFDPDDARGFDRSLREISGTTTGSIVVFGCAACLYAYAAFCALSLRYRRLDD